MSKKKTEVDQKEFKETEIKEVSQKEFKETCLKLMKNIKTKINNKEEITSEDLDILEFVANDVKENYSSAGFAEDLTTNLRLTRYVKAKRSNQIYSEDYVTRILEEAIMWQEQKEV